MILTSYLCDKCAELGVRKPADFFLLADEADLAGSEADGRTLAFLKWHMLCHRHHAELSGEARTAYVQSNRVIDEIF